MRYFFRTVLPAKAFSPLKPSALGAAASLREQVFSLSVNLSSPLYPRRTLASRSTGGKRVAFSSAKKRILRQRFNTYALDCTPGLESQRQLRLMAYPLRRGYLVSDLRPGEILVTGSPLGVRRHGRVQPNYQWLYSPLPPRYSSAGV
jgi:hypothetical protein